MSLLAAALAWASRGFRVFPLAPGTKIPPRGLAWKAEATTDPERIGVWWAVDPDCNVGVATGGGLVVVDVDTRVPGALGALMALDLPDDTLTVATPGGGFHLYYQGDDVANSAGKLGRGIDVRGAGGYVVAPGSYFADSDGAKGYKGSYSLRHDAPALLAPPHLILMAGAPRAKEDGGPVSVDDPRDIDYAIRYLQTEAPLSIEGRGGNDTAYRVAARMIEIGVSAETMTDLLAEHWNERCEPPWSRDELVAFAAHAETYAQTRQGSGGVAAAAEAFSGAVPLDATPEGAASSRFFDGRALFNLPYPNWLVEDVIPDRGVGLLAGQSRAGKSLLALRLARSVMTGEDFCERETVLRGGVLVLAAEAFGTLSERYRAVLGAKYTPGPREPDDLPFLASPVRGLHQLEPAIAEARGLMQDRWGAPLRLVLVDTLAAAFPVADENDQGEVTKLMQHMEACAAGYGCVIAGVHHFGKTAGTGARGSSAWTASSDFILAATGTTNEETGEVSARRLALSKSRSSVTGLLSEFSVETVEVGTRPNGRKAYSAIIRFTETRNRPGEVPRHFGAFENSFILVSDPATGDVDEAALREAFFVRAAEDDKLPKGEAKQEEIFRKARDHAIQSGLLTPVDGNPNVLRIVQP